MNLKGRRTKLNISNVIMSVTAMEESILELFEDIFTNKILIYDSILPSPKEL